MIPAFITACLIVVNINIASPNEMKLVVPHDKQLQAEDLYYWRRNFNGFYSIDDARSIAPDIIDERVRLIGPNVDCIKREL